VPAAVPQHAGAFPITFGRRHRTPLIVYEFLLIDAQIST
jgi:hypothetical protein